MTRHHRSRRLLAAASVLAAVVAGSVTPAAAEPAAAPRSCTITWVAPGDGKWSAAANWSPARTPRADDDVCLPLTGIPTVSVVKPDAVQTLATGNALLALSTGVGLHVGRTLVLDGSGGLRGGTLDAPSVVVPAGASAVLRGVVVTTNVIFVDAGLRMIGGATLRGTVAVLSGASITSDRDPGDLVDVRGQTTTNGTVTAQVPLRSDLLLVQNDSVASFPELVGLSPSGVLTQNVIVQPRGRLTVPYPVTTIVPGVGLTVAGPATSFVAASTGAPAFGLQPVVRGSLSLGGPASIGGRLIVAAGRLEVLAGAAVTTSEVLASRGGFIVIGRTAVLRLGADGQGRFTFGATSGGSLSLPGGALEGNLEQGSAGVSYGPGVGVRGEVRGNWTSGSASQVTLSTTGRRSSREAPTNLLVTGTAVLKGRVRLNVYGRQPQGYREVLLTATGGLTVDPMQLRVDTPGWRLSVGGNSIVATFGVPGTALSTGTAGA